MGCKQGETVAAQRAHLSLVFAAVFCLCLCTVVGPGSAGSVDGVDCIGLCANSGSCMSLENGSVCVCEESFTGTFCQSPLDSYVTPTTLHRNTNAVSVVCTESSPGGLTYKSWTAVAGSLGFFVGAICGAAVTAVCFKRGKKFTIRASKPKSRVKLPYVFSNDSVDGIFQQISRDTLSRTPEAVSRTRLNSVTNTLSQVYRRLNRPSWTRSTSANNSAATKGNNGNTDELAVGLADTEMADGHSGSLNRSPSSEKLVVDSLEHSKNVVIASPELEMKERATTVYLESGDNPSNGTITASSQLVSLSNDDVPNEKSMIHVSVLGTTPFAPMTEELEGGEG